MKHLFFTIFFFLVLVLGCQQPTSVDTSGEEAKVRETFDAFIDAIERGDKEVYFSFLTDDFVGYDPGRPPLTINDQFKSDMASFFETTTFKLIEHNSQEVIVRNDIAIHRHTGTLVLGSKKDSSLGKMTMKINYLDIMKKQPNGDWKFKMHTLNVSQ